MSKKKVAKKPSKKSVKSYTTYAELAKLAKNQAALDIQVQEALKAKEEAFALAAGREVVKILKERELAVTKENAKRPLPVSNSAATPVPQGAKLSEIMEKQAKDQVDRVEKGGLLHDMVKNALSEKPQYAEPTYGVSPLDLTTRAISKMNSETKGVLLQAVLCAVLPKNGESK